MLAVKWVPERPSWIQDDFHGLGIVMDSGPFGLKLRIDLFLVLGPVSLTYCQLIWFKISQTNWNKPGLLGKLVLWNRTQDQNKAKSEILEVTWAYHTYKTKTIVISTTETLLKPMHHLRWGKQDVMEKTLNVQKNK